MNARYAMIRLSVVFLAVWTTSPSAAATADVVGAGTEVAVAGQISRTNKWKRSSYAPAIQFDAGAGHNVELIGQIDTPSETWSVSVSGSLAYVGCSSGPQVVDVSNPRSPLIIGQADIPGTRDVCATCRRVYVQTSDRVHILDVSDPSSPTQLGLVSGSEPMFATDSYLYFGTEGGIRITDVSDLNTLGRLESEAIKTRCPVAEAEETGKQALVVSEWAKDVFVQETTAFSFWGRRESDLFPPWGGHVREDWHLDVFDVSKPTTPALLQNYSSRGKPAAVCAFGDVAYLATIPGECFVIGFPWQVLLCGANGVIRIDLRDGSRSSIDMPSAPMDVAAEGAIVCVADGDSGLQVVDFSDFKTPVIRGYYETPSVARGVFIENGLIYVADQSSGLWIFRLLERPNLVVSGVDVGPAAPVELQPGDSLGLGAFIENTGETPARPFWVEVWGSRTGGLTLDRFLTDSLFMAGGLAAGETYSWVDSLPLYSVPDGSYTVVFSTDRPGDVPESDERDNRAVMGWKRILVSRPSSDVDLVVESFSVDTNPIYTGEPLRLSGWVRNAGSESTGPFWIEFWGSYDRVYPYLHFFLCDSICVPDLATGEAIDLSQYSRTLYNCPPGVFTAGVFADRSGQVNDRDETNNYAFVDGISFNAPRPVPVAKESGPDLVVTHSDFAPYSPVRAQAGSALSLTARIENRGTERSGSFWIEFWGADHGGLAPRELLVESEPVASLAAGEGIDLAFERPLYSIPDGPYTVDVWIDRPNDVAEQNEGNNLYAVPGKHLLARQPLAQANLVIENFAVAPNALVPGRQAMLSGAVQNAGTEDSGPFWIEFWGSHDQGYPGLGFFLCDSIYVPGLAAGETLDLSAYSRVLYPDIPLGPCALIAFADRTDLVNETNEADNYVILRDYSVELDEITILLPGDVPLVMVRIAAGSFQMGSERSRNPIEGPVHTVNIAYDFYMGKYELTQQQWLALMGSWPGSTPSSTYGLGDDYPAYYLSWNDCQNFITALNTHVTNTGQGPATFRLPSEAEWEYACRAGTQTRFFFGDSLSVYDYDTDGPAGTLPGNRSDYMWWWFNCQGDANGAYGSKPVGTKLPNQFGLYDMSGNVWEWCQDWWHSDYTGAPADGSAWESPVGSSRVIRGGGWYDDAYYCRSATRSFYYPDVRYFLNGVRLLRTP